MCYGTGQGEIKRTASVLAWYVDAVKKRGRGFTIGEGKNVNSLIHVRDLAAAIILLVEEALEGGAKAHWGERGWYYVEHGETVFVDMANAMVKEMASKGVISGEGLDVLTEKETKELHPYAEVLWGSNIRVNAERIRRLGWSAKEGDVFSAIPGLLAE